MQSLGDNTLAAFLNTVSFPSSDNQNTCNNLVNNKTNSKIHNDESDIGKYFEESTVSFSENPTSSKNKTCNNKSEFDIIVSKNSTNLEEKENENLNESLELTTRSQIYRRCKLKQKITQNLKDNNVITEPVKKKPRENTKPLEQTSTNINIIMKSNSFSSEKNHDDNNFEVNNKMKQLDNLLDCPKLSLNNELSSQCEKNSIMKSSIEIPSIITTQDRVKLANWGLPLTILRKYETRGVNCMFPWQVECLKNPEIVEKYKNLVYSAPTSAGKTLVSEILIIKTVLERRKKVIFVLPFVSVVREKMYYFQDLFIESGVRVEGFMGGIHPPGGFSNTDVAIATIEKANSLINQLMEDDELENVGAVVIDELHLLGDPHRGYLLELLLTKLKYMNLKKEHVHVQLIGMSATLPNLNLLANWLDAELFKTDFRPVPLKELCKIGSTIYDDKLNILRDINPHSQFTNDPDNVLQLCFETIRDGHSVLIFCPTKNWCENLAQQISSAFFQLGREDTIAGRELRDQLSRDAILETLEQLKRTPVGLDTVLRNTVSFGVAFHHAGLTMDERDVIEGSFRSGALRVLTATSTLSSGVNLPARRVIVRTPIFHGKTIDILTYKQMVGRAGRMGKDTAGESVLVCKPSEKLTAINILNSSLQPIQSCLEGSCPLIRALLEVIASEVAYTHEDITAYMNCTLLSFINSPNKIKFSTEEAVDYLVKNELLLLQTTETGITRWVATSLGKACLAASVPPKDGLFLFEELQKARQCFVLDTELHVIYLVTPFNSGSQIGQIDWYIYLEIWKSISESERRVGELVGVKEAYLMSALRGTPKPGKILDIHKRFYTALALHDLVREVPLHTVCNKYNCCRGVIQSLQQTASTFAGMVTQFCKKLGWNCIELLVSQFQARLQFGVCRELLDLLRLPMLNGLRARSLYKEGITTVAELAMANELDVERALHKALPFESEKKKADEDDDEAARRNKLRTVFVTGKDGLTPRIAAIMLVNEARILLQNELGLEELPWDQKDRSKQECRIKGSSLDSGEAITASQITGTNTTDAIKSPLRLTTNSNIADNSTNTHGSVNNLSPSILSNKVTNEINCEEIRELVNIKAEVIVTEPLVHDENTGVKNNPKIMKSIEESSHKLSQKLEMEGISPKISALRTSQKKQSYSQSPNLFDDSLILDTQECNVLEQNIVDIDSEMFNDTVFSEANSPVLIPVNIKKNAKPNNVILNTNDTIFSETNSPVVIPVNIWKNAERNNAILNESPDLISTNKSLVWEEDTWYNTKILPDNLNKIQTSINDSEKITQRHSEDVRTPSFSRVKSMDMNSSTKSHLEKLEKVKKRICHTPDVIKSPIAKIITFDCERRLSTGSNKSEDDVVIESQTINSCASTKKTRTRMKLELKRTLPQNIAGKTLTHSGKLREKKPLHSDSMTQISIKKVGLILNDKIDENINSMILLNNNDAQNVINNSCKDVVEKKMINPFEMEIISSKSREPKEKTKKSESHKKSVPKELSIVNISLDKIKFNEFKRKITGKKDIALALGCEMFVTDKPGIGTRIINGNCYDARRKFKKNENDIYNDKKLCGVAVYWGRTVYYLSFENVQESNRVPVKERITLLINVLSKSDLNVRCFATKEIYKTLYKCCGLSSNCTFFDPSTADWLLNSDNSEKSFETLINEHLIEGLTLLQRLKNITGNVGPGLNVKSSVPAEIRACTEAVLTWHLSQSLSTKLEILDSVLLNTHYKTEMSAVLILSRMELSGIGINLPALQELSEIIREQLSSLENEAFALAGKKFNFLSSKSVAQVLGLDKGKKICTNKVILEQSEHPISNIIMNWRKLNATYTKMVCPLLNLAERHSRIYGECNMHTATGRVVMHEPNLQNVPRDFNSIDNSFVISVRMAFIPALGNTLVSADYCQLELRILAHFSKEPKLCSVFKKPGDVFKNIAARWYNKSESEIDDTMRQRTKQLCYGMIYGMGVKTLAETLQVGESEAREFLETFMNAYPGIKKWLSETIEDAREKGFITTLMNRRRMLPGLNDEISSEKRKAERQAINSKIQGSAADITKMGMILVDEKLKREYTNMPLVLPEVPVKRKLRSCSESLPRGAYLILQLHDELLYEVNALDLHRVVSIIKESMEQAYSLDVPLPVKIKTGRAWGDLTEYNFDSIRK